MAVFSPPDKIQLEYEYDKRINDYDELTIKCKEILQEKLAEKLITVISIEGEPKSFESFYKKIFRYKLMPHYFDKIEDIARFRIICKYYSELEKSDNVIEENFEVIRKKRYNFTERVDPSGYQSDHFIVKLLPNSLSELEKTLGTNILDLQCEIQVRTVLMHTWATVSHDVFYKKPHIHKDFEREMFAISSLFSFADQRFDTYHDSVSSELSTNSSEMLLEGPIDFDSLTSYIEQQYTDRDFSSPISVAELVHQLEVLGYTDLSQLHEVLTKSKHAFLTYEKENPLGVGSEKLDGVGVIRVSVAIGNSLDKTKDSFYVKDLSKYRSMMEG